MLLLSTLFSYPRHVNVLSLNAQVARQRGKEKKKGVGALEYIRPAIVDPKCTPTPATDPEIVVDRESGEFGSRVVVVVVVRDGR